MTVKFRMWMDLPDIELVRFDHSGAAVAKHLRCLADIVEKDDNPLERGQEIPFEHYDSNFEMHNMGKAWYK